MSEWNLAIVAAVLIAYAVISGRLASTMISSAMAFVTAGVVLGPGVTGWFEAELNGELIRTIAEITLTFVLFADASRIDLRALRRDYPLPGRLLAIGLPLTIVAGTLVGKLIWPDLPWIEAALLAVILAPTDAALGQAVVTDRRLPQWVSQGLNVESGLNDGICVPLLFILLATAEAEEGPMSGADALRVIVEEIGYGIVGGVVAASIGVAALRWGMRSGWMTRQWRQVAGLATAGLAYGIAAPLGGSGFIAAFVGGLVVAVNSRVLGEGWSTLLEGAGGFFDALTFFVFGAVVLGPVLDDIDWRAIAYAAASLTVIRIVPVAISLIGSGARWPTVGFVGWFGPRGLASIVFVVITASESSILNARLIAIVSTVTIAMSVYAHGTTAAPLSRRYRDWYREHPRRNSLKEDAEVAPHRWRWWTHGRQEEVSPGSV
ncbi:MAG TPA: sodium:proton antiporter [Ilumatobacteraceae bacterium]